MRLDRYLAEAAVGTKKVVRTYVMEGKVSVNHKIILNPAEEIQEIIDVIRYNNIEVVHAGKKYYMFHKPSGCITARKDDSCKTVLDYIDENDKDGLFPVGRLDKDTEGLLLLTNDGEFSHKLMYPDKHVDKTYYFWAFGNVDDEAVERLKEGVKIGKDELLAKAVHFDVEEQGLFSDLKDKIILEGIKEISFNPYNQKVTSGYLTITEGRKHQVKRMLKSVGCYVVYLKRVSIGKLMLDETLEKGRYRELTEDEIRTLYQRK